MTMQSSTCILVKSPTYAAIARAPLRACESIAAPRPSDRLAPARDAPRRTAGTHAYSLRVGPQAARTVASLLVLDHPYRTRDVPRPFAWVPPLPAERTAGGTNSAALMLSIGRGLSASVAATPTSLRQARHKSRTELCCHASPLLALHWCHPVLHYEFAQNTPLVARNVMSHSPHRLITPSCADRMCQSHSNSAPGA